MPAGTLEEKWQVTTTTRNRMPLARLSGTPLKAKTMSVRALGARTTTDMSAAVNTVHLPAGSVGFVELAQEPETEKEQDAAVLRARHCRKVGPRKDVLAVCDIT